MRIFNFLASFDRATTQPSLLERYLDRSSTHRASHRVVYVGTYTHKEGDFFVSVL
jgi:hypothetical protein